MIYLIGQAPTSAHYRQTTFQDFMRWVHAQRFVQLDIETNVSPWWCDKKLITIQFGSHTEDVQYVLQWSALSVNEKIVLKQLMQDPRRTWLIHNAAFECIVLRFHGIVLQNVYDTMLAEKVIYGGISNVEYLDDDEDEEDDNSTFTLASVAFRRLGVVLDKTEQTTFGDDILTEAKVLYAAEDVKHLSHIYRMQTPELGDADLDWAAALEMEAVLAYSEMTYYGMGLDLEMWRSNIALAQPLVDAAKEKLDDWLRQEPFHTLAVKMGFISPVDRVQIKWTSHVQRQQLLTLVFPDIEGASLGIVRKYLKTNPEHELLGTLQAFANKDYTMLEQLLILEHRETLISMGLLIPADTVTINWGSTKQVLPLFQVAIPKLKDLSKPTLAKYSHGIIEDYQEYKNTQKLLTSYGEKFIEKFVEPDGQVRTSFNQIVSTGRVSSLRPNMQNIPAKEAVGNRYRNCFTCPTGWKFVDSDYSSQELVCIAFLSKDPVWTEALEKGQDLHSVAAELVYGKKWKEAAEDDCAYYHKGKDKCKCKKHKTMRQACKTINFGLAYGMSAMKLSATLKITKQEAEQLIKDYFAAFPRIGALLTALGRFGVKHGYSRTMAPFFRRRYYPFWRSVRHYIDAHLLDIEYNATLGSIERASKNHPIQGSSADMIKLATVLIHWYIKDNNLQDRVRLVVQVHDQNVCIATEDYAAEWNTKMTALMEEAAAVFITNGLLKSETNVTDRWSK